MTEISKSFLNPQLPVSSSKLTDGSFNLACGGGTPSGTAVIGIGYTAKTPDGLTKEITRQANFTKEKALTQLILDDTQGSSRNSNTISNENGRVSFNMGSEQYDLGEYLNKLKKDGLLAKDAKILISTRSKLDGTNFQKLSTETGLTIVKNFTDLGLKFPTLQEFKPGNKALDISNLQDRKNVLLLDGEIGLGGLGSKSCGSPAGITKR